MSEPKNPVVLGAWLASPNSPTDSHDITLHDLFAAFALAGLLAAKEDADCAVWWAYRYADMMLAKREKKG